VIPPAVRSVDVDEGETDGRECALAALLLGALSVCTSPMQSLRPGLFTLVEWGSRLYVFSFYLSAFLGLAGVLVALAHVVRRDPPRRGDGLAFAGFSLAMLGLAGVGLMHLNDLY
jgi:hypothetical protein